MRSSANILSSDGRDTNSVGFGGTGPAISRSRLLFTSEFTICSFIISMLGLSCTSRFVIPALPLCNPKRFDSRGRRMSRPTSSTFLPKRAKDTARLAAVNVLPSPEVDEVNIMTFCPSLSINCRLVRIPRNISSIWLFLFSCTTMSAFVFAVSLARAISAMIGQCVRRATSSCPSMRNLSSSIKRSITSGVSSPAPAAMPHTMLRFGDICPVQIGSSSSLPLSAVAARLIEFSSLFCNSMV